MELLSKQFWNFPTYASKYLDSEFKRLAQNGGSQLNVEHDVGAPEGSSEIEDREVRLCTHKSESLKVDRGAATDC